jgi:hypothetical protein
VGEALGGGAHHQSPASWRRARLGTEQRQVPGLAVAATVAVRFDQAIQALCRRRLRRRVGAWRLPRGVRYCHPGDQTGPLRQGRFAAWGIAQPDVTGVSPKPALRPALENRTLHECPQAHHRLDASLAQASQPSQRSRLQGAGLRPQSLEAPDPAKLFNRAPKLLFAKAVEFCPRYKA